MLNKKIGKASLRAQDQVQVIAGREKGKVGKLLKVDVQQGRVLVENVNFVKKCLKRTPEKPGSIVQKEQMLAYSNVLLYCSQCQRGVRHGIEILKASVPNEKKKKVRVCKRCRKTLDTA